MSAEMEDAAAADAAAANADAAAARLEAALDLIAERLGSLAPPDPRQAGTGHPRSEADDEVRGRSAQVAARLDCLIARVQSALGEPA